MKKKLVFAGVALCFCAVVVAVVAVWGGPPRLDSRARRSWKDRAVAEITRQTSDAVSVRKQIGMMLAKASVEDEWDRWISKDLIVMTNGDWMVYRNICAKEKEHIPDLFIGRGSDGKWYYSTYHFCIDMIVLKTMLDQPGSLTKFRGDCFLQGFDGRSDDCLRKTWPLKR